MADLAEDLLVSMIDHLQRVVDVESKTVEMLETLQQSLIAHELTLKFLAERMVHADVMTHAEWREFCRTAEKYLEERKRDKS